MITLEEFKSVFNFINTDGVATDLDEKEFKQEYKIYCKKFGKTQNKKFVLNTCSESGNYYTYFIKHNSEPTNEELNKFLKKHANYKGFEYVQKIVEIDSFTKIPK